MQEAALSKAGPELYEKIFKHYTYKQWDKCAARPPPATETRLSLLACGSLC